MAGLRVAFFGTPKLAELVLLALEKALATHSGGITQIWTRPPAPQARGQKVLPCPVALWAEEHGYPVCAPEQLGAEDIELLQGTDLAVVFAYGEKLSPEILSAPAWGCINLHPSLLPRWRGATPCPAAILAGDKTSGWSWIRMSEKLDSGPILLQSESPIGAQETAEELETRLVGEAVSAIPPLIEGLVKGSLKEQEQDSAQATYAPRLTRADGKLNWHEPAEALARRVRAMTPWPGAWCPLTTDERLKILEARASQASEEPQEAGKVVQTAETLQVACGANGGDRLTLLRVQRSGRKPMTGAELARGFALPDPLPQT